VQNEQFSPVNFRSWFADMGANLLVEGVIRGGPGYERLKAGRLGLNREPKRKPAFSLKFRLNGVGWAVNRVRGLSREFDGSLGPAPIRGSLESCMV
jgi:hypothetical protein